MYGSLTELNELSWNSTNDCLLVASGAQEAGAIEIVRYKSDSGDLSVHSPVIGHTSTCFSLKINSTFDRMAVGGYDTLLSLWDLSDGDLICMKTL